MTEDEAPIRKNAGHESADSVIDRLTEILAVDRTSLSAALSALVSRRLPHDTREELSERAGLHVTNKGKGELIVVSTDLQKRRLEAGKTLRFLPLQFSLQSRVENAPYHALGTVPNAFLHLAIEPADDAPTTAFLDWQRMFDNSGLWGNLRLVTRLITAEGEVQVEPSRRLQWEVKFGGKENGIQRLELMGVGLGMDILSEFSPLGARPPRR
jgi:hypothetical protein